MEDSTDPLTLAIRTVILLVILGVFFFVLKGKKKEK